MRSFTFRLALAIGLVSCSAVPCALAQGTAPVKLLPTEGVEVNPATGDYIAITTLTGTESSANQALWAGGSNIFDSTPRLLLRMGSLLRIDGTSSALTSMSVVIPQSKTGAGGGGQPSCLGAETVAVVLSLANRTTYVARLLARPPQVD